MTRDGGGSTRTAAAAGEPMACVALCGIGGRATCVHTSASTPPLKYSCCSFTRCSAAGVMGAAKAVALVAVKGTVAVSAVVFAEDATIAAAAAVAAVAPAVVLAEEITIAAAAAAAVALALVLISAPALIEVKEASRDSLCTAAARSSASPSSQGVTPNSATEASADPVAK